MIRFCADLVDDFRWAIRDLSRRPTQTMVTVIMLAVGIGANGAVFAIVNAALFKGFAFVHENERLVQISTRRNSIYVPDVLEWQAQARTFQDIALVRGVFHTLNDQRDAPDTVFTTEVTPNTFRLLGVRPRFGRDFVEADSVPGAEPVVILRHSLWQRWFAADPAVIGRSIRLDGVPTTIIGVMPDGFTFPADQGLWTPLIPTAAALRRDTAYARYAYGRLAEGSSIDAAQRELDEIGQRLAQCLPNHQPGPAACGEPLRRVVRRPGRASPLHRGLGRRGVRVAHRVRERGRSPSIAGDGAIARDGGPSGAGRGSLAPRQTVRRGRTRAVESGRPRRLVDLARGPDALPTH